MGQISRNSRCIICITALIIFPVYQITRIMEKINLLTRIDKCSHEFFSKTKHWSNHLFVWSEEEYISFFMFTSARERQTKPTVYKIYLISLNILKQTLPVSCSCSLSTVCSLGSAVSLIFSASLSGKLSVLFAQVYMMIKILQKPRAAQYKHLQYQYQLNHYYFIYILGNKK